MYEEIIQIEGKKEGETSIILAGVHGNERCGVVAFEKILPGLEIESGRVLFGYGNPLAIQSDVRFVEANLNRMFQDDNCITENDKKSYEHERAQFLKKYLDQANALLDIHASFTKKSEPFIICEANARGIVEYLPTSLVVSGFDQVESGGTDCYMNTAGKIGVCIECGYFGDPKSLLRAEEGIFAFLKARGHITDDSIKPRKQLYIQMYDLYMTKTDTFTLSKPFVDFEEIAEGQTLGVDGDEEIRAEKSSIILFARDQNQIGAEAFLLGEKKSSLV